MAELITAATAREHARHATIIARHMTALADELEGVSLKAMTCEICGRPPTGVCAKCHTHGCLDDDALTSEKRPADDAGPPAMPLIKVRSDQ